MAMCDIFPVNSDCYNDGAHELCPLSLETKEFIIVTGFSVHVMFLDVSNLSLFTPHQCDETAEL